MLTKQQFINEIESSLGDVRSQEDCVDWWDSHIEAYLEDKLISKSALKWKNSFINQFEE